ncbi:MAG: type III pantothenate kinase [Leptospirales bacterium]|nr:type III pantothenate kinase [Leptospirales bacterium]
MNQYILAVDIGNSNTVFGLLLPDEGFEVVRSWRAVTRRDRTSDELGIFLLGFLETAGVSPQSVEAFLYSSVVPSFNPIVERMAHDYFQCDALRVTHDMGLPIGLCYPAPAEIGADRLVNAVAGAALYPGNLIIVDLGTATTFCLVQAGAFCGGAIAPGLKISIDTLSQRTAQLPPIEFRSPECGVVGDTTVHALQAGFFYGWVGLVREITQRMKDSIHPETARVIATGGLSATLQAAAPELFDVVDPLLTLRGLKILWRHFRTHRQWKSA